VHATCHQSGDFEIPASGDLNGSDLVGSVLQHGSTSCEARRANETVGPDLKDASPGLNSGSKNSLDSDKLTHTTQGDLTGSPKTHLKLRLISDSVDKRICLPG
jgi:hypothetical protein